MIGSVAVGTPLNLKRFTTVFPNDYSTPDRADAAVVEYLRCIDRGEIVDREQFLMAHREVSEELREFFAGEDMLRCFIRLCGWKLAGRN